MNPLPTKFLVEPVQGAEVLDEPAKALQELVGRLVPEGTTLKEVLSGTWLGHPLHPLLTDVVIGALTSSSLLDVLGGESMEGAADRLLGLGILAAVPTAAAGLSDWAELFGPTRRVGLAHATGNVTAVTVLGLSWIARKRGRRGFGMALSMLGYGVATVSAYLGGHLSFVRGVGVNQTAFEAFPTKWTSVIDAEEVPQGTPTVARAGRTDVLLVRRGSRILALADRCSHRGCALSDGKIEDDSIVCPCHGSTFRLSDGGIVRGPAIAPQPALEARVKGGRVEVRAKV